jgi:hypothetical protein
MLLGVYCFYFPELAEVIYKFSYFSSYLYLLFFVCFFCTIVCLYLDPIDHLSTRDDLCLNVYKTMKLPEMTMNIY